MDCCRGGILLHLLSATTAPMNTITSPSDRPVCLSKIPSRSVLEYSYTAHLTHSVTFSTRRRHIYHSHIRESSRNKGAPTNHQVLPNQSPVLLRFQAPSSLPGVATHYSMWMSFAGEARTIFCKILKPCFCLRNLLRAIEILRAESCSLPA